MLTLQPHYDWLASGKMSEDRLLRGACNCGRNIYLINIPANASRNDVSVFFDDSLEHRRSQATPLTAWLRVPLSWYQSSTRAYFPDESHGDIRRIFTPVNATYCKRTFCSYCGTHLSFWSEQPPSEADYLSVTLGSLSQDDIESLDELGLLPEDVPTPNLQNRVLPSSSTGNNQSVVVRQGTSGTIQWVEDMISGSRLGRIERSRRGVGKSRDGTVHVEWEISEIIDDGMGEEASASGFKRKLGE